MKKSFCNLEGNRWYSLNELLKHGKKGFLPIRSRIFWLKLLEEGRIPFYRKGTVYMIQGKVLIRYLQMEGALPPMKYVPRYHQPFTKPVKSVYGKNTASRKTAVLTPL